MAMVCTRVSHGGAFSRVRAYSFNEQSVKVYMLNAECAAAAITICVCVFIILNSRGIWAEYLKVNKHKTQIRVQKCRK